MFSSVFDIITFPSTPTSSKDVFKGRTKYSIIRAIIANNEAAIQHKAKLIKAVNLGLDL